MASAPPSSQIKFGSGAPKPSYRSLWIAIAFGILAAVISGFSSSGESEVLLRKAIRNIPAGTLVTDADFKQIRLLADAGNLSQIQRIAVTDTDFSAYKKIPLGEPLKIGDLLLQSSFSMTGGHKLSDSIPEGKRAITLPVKDEAAGMSYQIRVGDMIEVYGDMGNLVINGPVEVAALGTATLVPSSNAQYGTVTIFIDSGDVSKVLGTMSKSGGGTVRIALVGSARR
jgi:hypothetical protein